MNTMPYLLYCASLSGEFNEFIQAPSRFMMTFIRKLLFLGTAYEKNRENSP